jgi:UDP-N-acetylglucosamine 2-epimerase (hydrolysing)
LNNPKKIIFLTGTRADFGKIKPLIETLIPEQNFEMHLFVTGMHLMEEYGYTLIEIERCNYPNLHTFYNYSDEASMDVTLANTISGFTKFVASLQPDLIVIHGDRVEALAASIVGSLNNILVAHIEGGERSGTIDELMRHATSKLSHLHFVSNTPAKNRLIQMGETPECIFCIGSPDIDVMFSDSLPQLSVVKDYYKIEFQNYALALFHPITTEIQTLERDIESFIQALIESDRKYVMVYPNNDHGSKIILERLWVFKDHPNFRIFPSLRFEYFLTLLKNADFIIGNSSAGVREAPYYGVPTINVGSRQNQRAMAPSILNTDADKGSILSAIQSLSEGMNDATPTEEFGQTGAAAAFLEVLKGTEIWQTNPQKQFRDL